MIASPMITSGGALVQFQVNSNSPIEIWERTHRLRMGYVVLESSKFLLRELMVNSSLSYEEDVLLSCMCSRGLLCL